jgi:hypothetical protein
LVLDNLNDTHALGVELLFNLLLVNGETLVELLVLGVLLNCADGSNGGSLGSDLVLESNRQKVSFLSCEVLILEPNDLLEVGDHIVKPFGLLGDSGHENTFFETHCR